jgi:hypothetical protein
MVFVYIFIVLAAWAAFIIILYSAATSARMCYAHRGMCDLCNKYFKYGPLFPALSTPDKVTTRNLSTTRLTGDDEEKIATTAV